MGSFHADIWEVDEIIPYVESLHEASKFELQAEMKHFLDENWVNSKFMRNFVSDTFSSDDAAVLFFQGVMDACFSGKPMPNIDDYLI